ncbi:MAG: hypothetical protein R2854_13755 [Caldilineaceae bacterium]
MRKRPDSLGVSVNGVRYATLIIGGAMAGVAGASLSIGLLNVFQENMTNGLGFIAVALVYFGGWRPVGVLAGALLFSTVNALQLWIQVLGLPIPSDLAVMLPYVLTITWRWPSPSNKCVNPPRSPSRTGTRVKQRGPQMDTD